MTGWFGAPGWVTVTVPAHRDCLVARYTVTPSESPSPGAVGAGHGTKMPGSD